MKTGDRVKHRKSDVEGTVVDVLADEEIIIVDVNVVERDEWYLDSAVETQFTRDSKDVLSYVEILIGVRQELIAPLEIDLSQLNPSLIGQRRFVTKKLAEVRAELAILGKVREYITTPEKRCEAQGHLMVIDEVECGTCTRWSSVSS